MVMSVVYRVQGDRGVGLRSCLWCTEGDRV